MNRTEYKRVGQSFHVCHRPVTSTCFTPCSAGFHWLAGTNLALVLSQFMTSSGGTFMSCTISTTLCRNVSLMSTKSQGFFLAAFVAWTTMHPQKCRIVVVDYSCSCSNYSSSIDNTTCKSKLSYVLLNVRVEVTKQEWTSSQTMLKPGYWVSIFVLSRQVVSLFYATNGAFSYSSANSFETFSTAALLPDSAANFSDLCPKFRIIAVV